jgi:Protein of unknown function (DUF2877)
MPAPASPRLTTVRVRALGARLAERLGSGTSFPSRIHSVFARAINLEREDGTLLTLQAPAPLAAPFALALYAWGADLAGHAVALDLSGACRRDLCILPAVGDDESGWRCLAGALSDTPASIADGLRSPRGIAARAAMSEAVRRRDPARVAAATRRLIGLGEGLTPAGDDFVVGALAILHRFAAGWPVADGECAGALVAQARAGSTDVGAAFVIHAVAGEFSEPVCDLVMAGSMPAARAAATALAGMGATSGADTLAGMRATLAALADERP